MSVFTDEKEASVVTEGNFYVRDMGDIAFKQGDKIFQFPINRVSITLTSNTKKIAAGHSKHFTAYTHVMFDEFYESAGCYIDTAYLEWCVKNLEGGGDIWRTEEIKYISNFKMELDFHSGEIPVWRIDFDYGNY